MWPGEIPTVALPHLAGPSTLTCLTSSRLVLRDLYCLVSVPEFLAAGGGGTTVIHLLILRFRGIFKIR